MGCFRRDTYLALVSEELQVVIRTLDQGGSWTYLGAFEYLAKSPSTEVPIL